MVSLRSGARAQDVPSSPSSPTGRLRNLEQLQSSSGQPVLGILPIFSNVSIFIVILCSGLCGQPAGQCWVRLRPWSWAAGGGPRLPRPPRLPPAGRRPEAGLHTPDTAGGWQSGGRDSGDITAAMTRVTCHYHRPGLRRTRRGPERQAEARSSALTSCSGKMTRGQSSRRTPRASLWARWSPGRARMTRWT